MISKNLFFPFVFTLSVVFSYMIIIILSNLGQPLNQLIFVPLITILIILFTFFIITKKRKFSNLLKYFPDKDNIIHSVYIAPLSIIIFLTPSLFFDSISGLIINSLLLISYYFILLGIIFIIFKKWKNIVVSIILIFMAIIILFASVNKAILRPAISLITSDLKLMNGDVSKKGLSLFERFRIGAYFGASPFLALAMGSFTAARLSNAWLNGYMPSNDVINVFRKQITSNIQFKKLIKKHNIKALASGKKEFLARYILRKIDMKHFGLKGIKDDWAFRAYTVIKNGKPYTSFLFRPGMVFKKSNYMVFPEIKIKVSGVKVVVPVKLFVQAALRYKFGKPFFMNITESEKTSSVSRKRIDMKKWIELSKKLY